MHSASNNNNSSSSSGGNQSNCNLNCNQINFSSSSTSTSSLSCVKDHFLFRHSSPVSSAGMRPLSGAETDSSTETPHNNPLNHPHHNLQPLQQQQQQQPPQSYRGRHYHHYSPSNNRRYFEGSNSAQFDASAPPLPSPPSPLSPLQFLSPAASSSIPYEMSSNSSSSFLPCPTSPFRTTSSSFQRSGSVGSGGSGSVGSVIYVYEIPYHVRKEICDLLDADNSWRELGGRYMGFNDTQLTLISHALYRSASPTNELLTKWESSNAKVSHLYRFLAAMKHRRAMYRLLPYVDDKLKLLYDQFDTNEINQIDQQQQQQQHHAHLDSSLFQRDQRHLTDKLVDLNLNSFLIDNSIEATAPAPFNRSQLHHNNRQYSNNHHHINKLNNNQHSSLMLNHRQEFLNNNNNINNNILNNQINLNHKRININDNNNNLGNNSDEERTLVDLDKKNVENANANNQINNNNNNNNPLLDNKDQKLKNQTIDVLVRIEDFEISYKELVISTDDFCKDNILGSGGFGTVYIGEWKGTKVAVKKLKGVDNLSQALTELRILNCCRIDNILPLYAVSLDGPEPCLVYQYMPNGSLEDRLLCKNGTTPLSWLQRSKIAEGVARALNFLHTLKGNPFVHGDVKSANILLDPLFEPKLGDFGLARQVVKDSRNTNSLYTHCTVSSVNGTSVYLPAEYLRHKILSPAVDVYSYGIVVLEMATGRRAYDGKKLLINLVEDEYSRAQNVAAQNRVQSPLHHNPLLQQPQLHHSSGAGGGGGEQNSKLENIHQALMDKRIGHLMGDDRHWFNCLLELGRKCAHKTKSKRPIMIQILEYFNQCKTTDRIHKLCDHAIQNRQPLSKINFSKSNIKSPLELQLWYDFVRKSCGTLSEAVFENFGAQVTRMIEDIKFTFSNESAFHLDFLLNSQVPNNSSGTEASNSSDSGELNPVPIQSKPQVQGSSSLQSNRNNSDSNLGTSSNNPDSGSSVNNNPVDGFAIESTNNQSPPPLSPVVDSSPANLIEESIPAISAINRLTESRQLPNIAGSLPDNIGSYFHPLNNSTVASSSNNNNNNNNPPLMHSHSSPSTSSLTIPLSIASLQSETATNNPLSSTTSIPFIPLLTALGFNPSDIDDVLLKK